MNFQLTDAVKHLLIINVLFFIATHFLGEQIRDQMFIWFAMWLPDNEPFRVWQILSHMFMHGDSAHLLFNMFGLWMFGVPVERSLGRNRFLFLYFSAGLGAVILQVAYFYFSFPPGYVSTMVGASGCIMGVLAAFGVMNPNAELMLIFLPIPIKAKYFVPLLMIGFFIMGVGNYAQGIAHFAHLGGAIIGAIVMWYWKKNSFNHRRWDR